MATSNVTAEHTPGRLRRLYSSATAVFRVRGEETSALEIVTSLSLLLFVSAVWSESDAYRYAAIVLLIPAAYHYLVVAPGAEGRPAVGLVGLMCFAFGIYVGLRFAVSFLMHPDRGTGSAAGIYLFMLGYVTVGYAMLLYVRRPFLVVCLFVAASCVFVVGSLDFESLRSADRAANPLHNNPIHAAACSGFILLCMIPFILHVLQRNDLSRGLRWALVSVAVLTFVAALSNVLTLNSKGVWLALSLAFPLQLIMACVAWRSRVAWWAVLITGLITVTMTVMAWDRIVEIGGNTTAATLSIIERIADGESPLKSIDIAINNPANSVGVTERLALWANALSVWAEHPVFGAGIGWLYAWQDRPYAHPNYDILHNSYLEVAVRYGLIGLAFYAVLYGWATRQVWLAARSGLIAPAAFLAYLPALAFFALTSLTNSNIRLALGESYMWFAASLGFCCYYAQQRVDRLRQSA